MLGNPARLSHFILAAECSVYRQAPGKPLQDAMLPGKEAHRPTKTKAHQVGYPALQPDYEGGHVETAGQ